MLESYRGQSTAPLPKKKNLKSSPWNYNSITIIQQHRKVNSLAVATRISHNYQVLLAWWDIRIRCALITASNSAPQWINIKYYHITFMAFFPPVTAAKAKKSVLSVCLSLCVTVSQHSRLSRPKIWCGHWNLKYRIISRCCWIDGT